MKIVMRQEVIERALLCVQSVFRCCLVAQITQAQLRGLYELSKMRIFGGETSYLPF